MAPFSLYISGSALFLIHLSPNMSPLHLPHPLYFSSLDSGHQRLSPLLAFFGEMTTWDATICHIYLNYLQFWSFCFPKEVILWVDFWQVPACGSCSSRGHVGAASLWGSQEQSSPGSCRAMLILWFRQCTEAACGAQCALCNCLFTSRLWLLIGSYQ